MRAFWLLVVGCSLSAPAASALYRHVDEAGNVTYSDRPRHPQQETVQLPPPNVATPEARRQLELARQTSEREQQAEFDARMRRWAAAQRTPPAAYPRTLSSGTPRYAGAAYTVIPTFTNFTVGSNAGSSTQSHPPQGLRAAGFSHRAHHTRR